MNADALDVRLLRFRSKRDESPQVLAADLLSADRVSEALEVVHAGLLDAEDDPELLVLEGRAWYEDGDLPQAQAALLRAAKRSPTHVEAYRWLSQVLMKRGEPARAVKVLERAVQIRPDDAELRKARERAQRLARIAVQADTGNLPAPGPAAPEPEERSTRPPPQRSMPRPSFGGGRSGTATSGEQKSNYKPPRPGAVPVTPSGTLLMSGQSTDSVELDVSVESPRHAPPVSGRQVAATRQVDDPREMVGDAQLPSIERVLSRSQPPEAGAASSSASDTDDEDTGDATVVRDDLARELQERLRSDVHDTEVPPPPQPLQEPPMVGEAFDDDEATAMWSEPVPEEALPPSEDSVTSFDLGQQVAQAKAETGLNEEATVPRAQPYDALEPATPFQAESAPLGQAAAFDDEPTGLNQSAAPRQPEPPPPSTVQVSEDLQEPAAAQHMSATAAPGEAEPPEVVLQRVKDQGLFEGGQQDGDARWVARGEAAPERTKLGGGLLLGWVLALALTGGGYYGWTRWIEHREQEATELVAQAAQQLAEGDHQALVRAEAMLGRARDLQPKSEEVARSLTVLQSMRAVEEGNLEIGYLRSALARLEQTSSSSRLYEVARGIAAFCSQNVDVAGEAVATVGEDVTDGQILYLTARLAQWLGTAEADALLERATMADGVPAAVHFANIEAAFLRGRETDALAWVEPARGDDGESLRADLWELLLVARQQPDAALQEKVEQLSPRAAEGATTDKLLLGLAQARLGASLSDEAATTAGIEAARSAGASDPQLLALLARVASQVGKHDVAYAAARGALEAAPSNPRYRDELVRALLQRGDGTAVQRALQGVEGDARWVSVARARAALLTGDKAALTESADALAQLDTDGRDVELSALKARVDLAAGKSPRRVLSEARKLARLEPGDGNVQLALGEAALAANQPDVAVEALEKAKAVLPQDGQLLFLLAQAYRGSGRAEDAKRALEEALVVAPRFAAAQQQLAEMLLDRGEFEAAEKRYAALERNGGGLVAKLGRAEALVGRGSLLDARDVLAELDDDQKQGARATVVDVKLLLAMGNIKQALTRIEPLLEGETRTADVLSLYGDVLYADDQVDPAAGAYDAALDLDSGHPEALIGRAHAAVRAEKTRKAHDWLDAAEKSLERRARPASVGAKLRLVRGKAHMLDRDFGKAREVLAEATEVPGTPPETFFWYAESLALTKQPGARENYERYLELAPRGELASRAQRALKPR